MSRKRNGASVPLTSRAAEAAPTTTTTTTTTTTMDPRKRRRRRRSSRAVVAENESAVANAANDNGDDDDDIEDVSVSSDAAAPVTRASTRRLPRAAMKPLPLLAVVARPADLFVIAQPPTSAVAATASSPFQAPAPLFKPPKLRLDAADDRSNSARTSSTRAATTTTTATTALMSHVIALPTPAPSRIAVKRVGLTQTSANSFVSPALRMTPLAPRVLVPSSLLKVLRPMRCRLFSSLLKRSSFLFQIHILRVSCPGHRCRRSAVADA